MSVDVPVLHLSKMGEMTLAEIERRLIQADEFEHYVKSYEELIDELRYQNIELEKANEKLIDDISKLQNKYDDIKAMYDDVNERLVNCRGNIY